MPIPSPHDRRPNEGRSRINRLVRLIGFLQAGKPQNAVSLARECRVSRRTIFRDLDVLKQAGVPLRFDAQHRQYSIPSSYYLPPTNFTAEEALAVMVLCGDAAGDGKLPFLGAAQSAALKLEGSLPAPLRQHLRASLGTIHVQPQPRNPLAGLAGVYRELLAAAADHEVLRIEYESFAELETIHTQLSPYQLLFSRHSWYVIGRSSLHREVRTFNVGRIRALAPSGEVFHLPRNFSLEQYLGNAWHLIPEPGPDQQVQVRFARLVARNVAEVIWHKTQRVEFRPDGALDFFVTVSGLNEISWWVLGYGDQAEVIRPARLRELVAERARRMVALYAAPRGEPGAGG